MTEQAYIYRWRNNSKRLTMYGRRCTIFATRTMNSVAVRFTDNGQIEITSRHALRKAPDHTQTELDL